MAFNVDRSVQMHIHTDFEQCMADTSLPALCRICEPIAYMSIFPYIYYMIKSFDIADNEDAIAGYCGLVTSAFAIAEFSCAVLWGRLSDVIGRKPVLLIGLAGTGISMFIFGFAQNLQTLLIARALGGMLNGNIGVIQTTVAEVIRGKEEHQARAYSVVPFVWTVGGIVGSALGGFLAMPVQNFPGVFDKGTIWDKFPFLLPNLVCAGVVVLGLIVGFLFLEETHEEKQYRRDPGRELGKWLTSCFSSRKDGAEATDERTPLLQEASTTSSRKPSATTSSSTQVESSTDAEAQTTTLKPSFASAFTPQVSLQIVAYGIIAYHTSIFGQLFPIMLSMPISHKPTHLPFQFTGGFALHSNTIGLMYVLQGIYNMFVQLVVFPYSVNSIGTFRTFRFVLYTYALLYIFTPYLVLLSGQAVQILGVSVIVALHITYASLAYPCSALLLANSAPSLMVLGTINGVAASAAALCRAGGPTLSGFLQGWGLKRGSVGVGWWSGAVAAVLGAFLAMWLRDPNLKEEEGGVSKVGTDDAGRRESFSSVEVGATARDAPVSSSEGAGLAGGRTLVEDEQIGLLAERQRRER